MNFAILVKQVPEIALISVDSAKGEIVHPQGPGVMNPFDAYAIEEALRWKEKLGGKTIALSVGGKDSEVALREALSLGVDEAILLSDPAFERADNQAVAAILAAGVRRLGQIDLVLGGKQAVDSDDAMVPAAVAARLDWSQAMFVRKVRDLGAEAIVVERTTEDGFDVVELKLPAVLSLVKEINEPRLPSLKGKMAAKKAQVAVWDAGSLGLSEVVSPTRSVRAANPPPRPAGEMISGETPAEIAEALFKKLRENQVI